MFAGVAVIGAVADRAHVVLLFPDLDLVGVRALHLGGDDPLGINVQLVHQFGGEVFLTPLKNLGSGKGADLIAGQGV
jgi:hypothetical protein